MNAYHLIKEENVDTQNMTLPSKIRKLELNCVDLSCCIDITSPCLTDKLKEGFHVITELFIEPSCFELSSYFLLSLNHEYVLEYFSCLHILKQKNNNVD